MNTSMQRHQQSIWGNLYGAISTGIHTETTNRKGLKSVLSLCVPRHVMSALWTTVSVFAELYIDPLLAHRCSEWFLSIGTWKLTVPLVEGIAECSLWGLEDSLFQEGRDSLLGILMWEGEKEHPVSSAQPDGPGDKAQASILAFSLLHTTRGLPSHGRRWKQRRHHTKFNWSEERGPKSCARQGKPSVLSIYQPALVLRGVQLYVWKPHAVFTSARWGRCHNASLPAGKGSHGKCKIGSRCASSQSSPSSHL